MQVSDVMTQDVKAVTPQTPLEEAARMMRDEDVGVLPVGDSDRLVGMVTDRDIVVRAVAEGRAPAELKVSDVLTPEIYFCREDDSLEDAADIMAEHQVRRLPVLDQDGRLRGIVALADVVQTDPDTAGEALEVISEPESAKN
jgi:CBS domain-containing protein